MGYACAATPPKCSCSSLPMASISAGGMKKGSVRSPSSAAWCRKKSRSQQGCGLCTAGVELRKIQGILYHIHMEAAAQVKKMRDFFHRIIFCKNNVFHVHKTGCAGCSCIPPYVFHYSCERIDPLDSTVHARRGTIQAHVDSTAPLTQQTFHRGGIAQRIGMNILWICLNT